VIDKTCENGLSLLALCAPLGDRGEADAVCALYDVQLELNLTATC
jgi:hypothetical protein